ncbi:Mam33p NDAI_0A02410 [Naumovozyma dairenensis CBS 421]|uniref:Mitochondrial acidic protein MAM33 n=1 Tax=Naumovozyma dairenensis (strain ATCC 10597 / BCRC 20456 / CBS 421 / NBRC 0211 / NRRL Y-12639) TaxID=1071378 RepID=G0W3L1_NAUDC|nr:hypothetical protein NDAI_0A02410 [Naumovozyma dairenensis CBS 421]CCD22399.1 hypothetical protein NDAI_0A02410 [Naumovozyma dairenensis CBS 421]
MFISMFGRMAARGALNTVKTPILSQSLKRVAATSPSMRSFVSTKLIFNQQKQNVLESIKSELKIEKEGLSDLSESPFKKFLEDSGFNVVETPGKNEAQIVKKSEDGETVHVNFDVAQVANLPYDSALAENLKDEVNEVNEEPTDPEEEDFDSLGDNFANVNVVITKSDDSALSFELLLNLQEGSFYVDSVTPFKSSKQALDESAEAEISRELVYHGPPFSNLDEELQESLESYLESRGITEELAAFIGSYSEFKENNEYVSWLENMDTFFKK